MVDPRGCAGPRWLAAVLAVILAAACASPTPPAIERDGVGLWRRVETDHFVIESNSAQDWQVLRAAREFETLWHAYARVPILGLRPPEAKPLVVLLRNRSEYNFVLHKDSAGAYLPETPLGPLVLLAVEQSPFRALVIKHELAHFVSADFLREAPLWLKEGVATVMETASYDADAGRIVFGAHLPGREHAAGVPIPSERFLGEWPDDLTPVEIGIYYSRSWLAVHYLIDFHLEPFLRFLHRVAGGQPWRQAWAEERLPRFSDLDDALLDYQRRGRYGLWQVRAEGPSEREYALEPVPLSDALALRSLLLWVATGRLDRPDAADAAAADLRRALDIEPSGQRARRLAAALGRLNPPAESEHGQQ